VLRGSRNGEGHFGRVLLPLGIVLALVTGLGLLAVRFLPATGPTPYPGVPAADYVPIGSVPRGPAPAAAAPGASTGSFTEDCGRNAGGQHRNADNLVMQPGIVGGAHHVHDYVGNLSTDALSTDASLAAAGTTCTDGDRSTYYWPVLLVTGAVAGAQTGAEHGTAVDILQPSAVRVEYLGNAVSDVVAMPRFLRLVTGDPRAVTDGGAQARATWGCTGFPGRTGTAYPLCPSGSSLTRTFDFPSCWDGRNTDAPDHRAQLAFPAANGVCPTDSFPVPRLVVDVTYELPPGVPFAVDSFPDQHNAPSSDHAMAVDVMTDGQMARVVACLNSGQHCS
jgi:hypothetical protein